MEITNETINQAISEMADVRGEYCGGPFQDAREAAEKIERDVFEIATTLSPAEVREQFESLRDDERNDMDTLMQAVVDCAVWKALKTLPTHIAEQIAGNFTFVPVRR